MLCGYVDSCNFLYHVESSFYRRVGLKGQITGLITFWFGILNLVHIYWSNWLQHLSHLKMSVLDLWHRSSELQDGWSREYKGYRNSLSFACTSEIQSDFLAFALHQSLLIMASYSLGLCFLPHLYYLLSWFPTELLLYTS